MAKAASVNFEDEPYVYLAVGRQPKSITPRARIVSRVHVSKVEVRCRVCAHDGDLADQVAPRRDRGAYAKLRRAAWGDALLMPDE